MPSSRAIASATRRASPETSSVRRPFRRSSAIASRAAAFGVSTAKRADIVPEIPTLAEQGLAGYDLSLWFGMWAPSGTPIPVVQKLNAAVNAIVFEPAVKEQFTKLGIEPAPMKPDEFAKFVRNEIEVYKKIVQAANIPQQ